MYYFKTKSLLFLIPLVVTLNSFAQIVFQSYYQVNLLNEVWNNRVNTMCATSDGGYFLSGMTGLYGTGIPFLKTDANGEKQFFRSVYGNADIQTAYSSLQTSDGGFLVAGTHWADPNVDAFVIRTDQNGNISWFNLYSGPMDDYDGAFSVVDAGNDEYILVGAATMAGVDGGEFMLIKIDGDGVILWYKTVGGYNWEYPRYCSTTSDGGLIVTGYSNSYGAGGEDVFVVQFSSSGSVQWAKVYGGQQNDRGTCIKQSVNGGFLISGYTLSFGAGYVDGYVLKTDAAGSLQWSLTLGGTGTEYLWNVTENADQNIFVTGYATSFSYITNVPDSWITLLNPAGNLLWSKTYGIEYGNEFNVLVPTSDGAFAAAGYTYSLTGDNDFYMVKVGENGSSGCPDSSINPTMLSPSTVETNALLSFSSIPITASSSLFLSTSPAVLDSVVCWEILSPKALFSVSDTIICEGECLDFTDLSQNNPNTWEWIFTGAIPGTSADQNPKGICYQDPGSFPVTLKISNTFGSDNITKIAYIQVLPPPPADAGQDLIISKGTSVQLNASGGVNYSWLPDTTLSDLNIADPIAGPEVTTTYYVNVTGANGCTTTDSVRLTVVSEGNIFIPNAFTPNGDNLNDFFEVSGTEIENIGIMIFNRWGEQVYYSENSAEGWNGKWRNKEQPAGVYTYLIRAKFKNGEDILKKGTFALLK